MNDQILHFTLNPAISKNSYLLYLENPVGSSTALLDKIFLIDNPADYSCGSGDKMNRRMDGRVDTLKYWYRYITVRA